MDIIKFSDIFDEGGINSGLKGLIDKVGEVETALTNMLKQVKAEAKLAGDALVGTTSSTKEGRNNTTQKASEVEKLYAAYEKLGLKIDYCKNTLSSLIATQDRESKATKLAKTVNEAKATSIARLRAEIGLAKLALEGMHEWQRENTDEGKSLTRTIIQLESIVKDYEKGLKGVSTTQQSVSNGNKKTQVEFNDLAQAYQKLLTGVTDFTESYIVAGEDTNEVSMATAHALKEVTMSEKDKEKAVRAGIVANDAATGSYREAEAEYKLINLLLDNMTKAQRNSADMGIILGDRALELRDKMKAWKESVGDSTLSVGNYEKAMNGLNIATKQVLREMPTLANSVNTFFIAISNNIPIFIDSLKRAAKEAGGVKKALSALFSTQFLLEGVMLVGLTLLSKYGSQWLSNIKIFQNANKILQKSLDLHKQLSKEYDNVANALKQEQGMEEAILERRITQLKAQNAPLQQIQAAENALLAVRKQNISALKQEYKDNLLGTDVIKDYTANTAQWIAATKKLRVMQEMATANAKKNGELRKHDKDAIETQQKLVDYYKERVDAAEELLTAERNLTLESNETAARQYAEKYELYRKELEIERTNQDIILELVEGRYERERKIAVTETERQIEDINDILKKAPDWLSDKQIEAYTNQIGLLRKKLTMELIESFHDEEEAIISLSNANRNIELDILKDGQDKEIETIKENTRQRQAELIRRYLYEKDLSETERKEIIKQWSLAGKQGTIAESNVILNYAQRDLQTALNYKLAVINSAKDSEYNINRKSIEEQIQYWKDYLENIKKYGNLSEAELANVTTEVKTEILNLTTEYKKTKWTSLSDILGVDSDSWGKIKDMFETYVEYMDEFMDKRIEMAEIAVEAAQRESEAAKTNLDYEMEARANGYANNVDLARREYEEKLAIEQKAIAEKQRLEKIQEGIDTVMQISSLVTATAQLWAAYASIPFAGQALAIAATALMWGSFAAAKIQAAQLANAKTYGEGGMEYINYGGSHASGNDVDFGHTKEGRARRVEKGEVVSVINKKNVEKYGVSRIENIINSLNNGTFEKQYISSSIASSLTKSSSVVESTERNTLGDMYSLAFSMLGMPTGDSADLSSIERGISTLVSQNDVRIVPTPYGRIEYRGNNTRIIRNS